MGIGMYICLKPVLYCPGMYPEVPGEMQIIKSLRVFLNAVISFTYAYSLVCQWVMAQIPAKVERRSQDDHLHSFRFFQLGRTLSPEQ